VRAIDWRTPSSRSCSRVRALEDLQARRGVGPGEEREVDVEGLVLPALRAGDG
jgi:hypothetical protein